jgi:hypothetical protein
MIKIIRQISRFEETERRTILKHKMNDVISEEKKNAILNY